MRQSKLLFLLLFIILIVAYFVFDVGQYFSLAYLQEKHQTLLRYAAENRVLSRVMYFLLYVVAAMLSLPGISLLTIGAGAIFGVVSGIVLVSFASAIGATLAFLFSRHMFADAIQGKFSSQLETINRGVEKEGAFYLFTMRLIPVIPFFVINLLMGLTSIKTSLFYLVSQVGMFPTTAVFVYAGNQLAQITTLSDILSPTLLFAFALLGILPFATKRLIELYKRKKSSINY